ncbi:transmembrane protein 272-like [Cololabis saira]|uniref:transmembrane protein 272-like n=1 Tax=Cololabis saira TaxID=129043 RepID=UPI002AD4148C|nr:transmembrane protein 272-like [Cololabis saira]
MDLRPQSSVLIATIVMVNIIWWMVMIAAIGVGATTLSLCPVQPYIPIYLLVLGASSIISLSATYMSRTNTDGAVHTFTLTCMVFLHLFSFVWLIVGTCWIYSIYPPNYAGPDRHCHKTTYQFAFVVTTLLWVIMALVFFCGGCFALLTCCTTIVATRHLIPNRVSFYGATSDITDSSSGNV